MDLSNESMVHVKKDKIEYLQFKKLLEYKEIVHCYTLSVNNINFKMNQEKEEESIKKLCDELKISQTSIVRPKQNHTDIVKIIDKIDENIENVDGLITNKKNINMMLSFADCTPIIIYDPVKNIIANIHSGWRGTVQKIGQKAVLKIIKEYNSNPKDLIVCLGPCIGKCHFEVKEDVKNIFEKNFKYLNRNSEIIEQSKDKEGKFFIDTTLINRLILEEVGIKKENIIESNICTACNSNIMHSHRINGDLAGRNICIIGLKN